MVETKMRRRRRGEESVSIAFFATEEARETETRRDERKRKVKGKRGEREDEEAWRLSSRL